MFLACLALCLHLPDNYEHGILFYVPACHIVGEKKRKKKPDCVYVYFLTSFLCYQELESTEPILTCGGRDIIRIKLSLGSRPVTLWLGQVDDFH